jgi:DNA-binding MurR/RpiR family transcriptional regulator
VLENVLESDINKIRYTIERLDRDAFYKSVEAILSAKSIYVMGARSTESLALVLSYNLSLIFDNVKSIQPKSTAEMFEQMFSISKDDVLIAFSFPRYSSKSVSAVNYASHKGATVITLTDSNFSPLARYSSYLLTAQSDMASFMDSFVAPLSIINAIIVEITNRREIEIKNRFNLLEEVWTENKVYTVSS